MENPNGAVQGNSQNVATAHVPRTRSTFPLKYHFFDTHRFGEYHPHFVEDSVKDDDLPIHSTHKVMSYTMKSPLMQSISMKKDYFAVPKEAILPLNFQKFFENPVIGDDVSDDVGCGVKNFWYKVYQLMVTYKSTYLSIINGSNSDAVALNATFRFLVLGEYFYSNGNLLSSLGCHGAPYHCFYGFEHYNWDDFVDEGLTWLVSNGYTKFTVDVGDYTYNVNYDTDNNDGDISFRHFLCLIRDEPFFGVQAVGTSGFRSAFKSVLADTTTGIGKKFDKLTFADAEIDCNIERLWAYQLCCAHYYTNDHVDFVYSADLFRQLIGYFATNGYNNLLTFYYNGLSYQYDYMSAAYFDAVLGNMIASSSVAEEILTLYGNTAPSYVSDYLGYLAALFAFRRSLRYLDYFTGSRCQPLAVGSTGVSVVGGQVDVVDITRNIQKQRFLNAVNRVRHNFEGYLKGIFGGETPAPDYHNPFYLAHTDDVVYGDETPNTGNAQIDSNGDGLPIAITSNLRSNASRFMFTQHSDRPCIVLGITWYDIPRIYTKTTERPFFHMNRFDSFNPFMQYIGDQPIYYQELGIGQGTNYIKSLQTFAYSLRHMEYKQRFNQAAGGFCENLPGWIFRAKDWRGTQYNLNPDWIRSVNSELDEFYISLTGYSLGTYFHFIVDNENSCSASRPMSYAPSIL